MVKGLLPDYLEFIQILQQELEFLSRHGVSSHQCVPISPGGEANRGHNVFGATAVERYPTASPNGRLELIEPCGVPAQWHRSESPGHPDRARRPIADPANHVGRERFFLTKPLRQIHRLAGGDTDQQPTRGLGVRAQQALRRA
jgi:hypothetical protein